MNDNVLALHTQVLPVVLVLLWDLILDGFISNVLDFSCGLGTAGSYNFGRRYLVVENTIKEWA